SSSLIFGRYIVKKLEKMAEIDIDPKTEIEDKVKAILKLIKDGELDLIKICEEKLKLENEISQLAGKNLEQEDELGKLKKELTARTKNCSALQRKLNTAEKDASRKINGFTTEVEKLKKEHAQTLAIIGDNEKNELASKIMDLQRTLKEQEDAYQKLNEEYKQVDSKFNECKANLEVAIRKIEEKEEELRESIASKDQIVTDLEH
ncbi:hypothetical protein L195_g051892, partial [Trifolium pratense]